MAEGVLFSHFCEKRQQQLSLVFDEKAIKICQKLSNCPVIWICTHAELFPNFVARKCLPKNQICFPFFLWRKNRRLFCANFLCIRSGGRKFFLPYTRKCLFFSCKSSIMLANFSNFANVTKCTSLKPKIKLQNRQTQRWFSPGEKEKRALKADTDTAWEALSR